jgi:hypothetical protein
MSNDIPPAEPVASAPKEGTVKPNNQYQDIIGELPTEGTSAPVAKKPLKPGIKPNNQYQDSAPKE